MVVVRGKGSSGDGQKRKVAIVRAAISFPVLVCFKEVGNKIDGRIASGEVFRRIGRKLCGVAEIEMASQRRSAPS